MFRNYIQKTLQMKKVLILSLLIAGLSSQMFAQTSQVTGTTQALSAAWASAATQADSAEAVLSTQATVADVSPIYGGSYREWPTWLHTSLQEVRQAKLAAVVVAPASRRNRNKLARRPAKRKKPIKCGSGKARRTYSGMGYGRPGGRR